MVMIPEMILMVLLESSSETQGQSVGSGKKASKKRQVRAKEPQGTDSHRTIPKNSSGYRLPIGRKECFVLLCPIGDQFLLSSFREFVHDGYCLATLARFVHQACAYRGNFYFLTRNKGTTNELKKRLGYYRQEQLKFPREYSVFDGSQLRCGGDEKFK